jgi:hypothetical protein
MFLAFWAVYAIPGTINTTKDPNGPSEDTNNITPPRIQDVAQEVILYSEFSSMEDYLHGWFFVSLLMNYKIYI